MLFCLTRAWAAATPETLPGSAIWDFPANIAGEQYTELRAYFESKIAEAAKNRQPPSDIVGARRELRKLIGAIDTFLKPEPKTEPLSDFGPFTAALAGWPVLRGGNDPPTQGTPTNLVREYGVLLTPKSEGRRPAVIVVPDADQSAADLSGLTPRLSKDQQTARTLAEGGFVVFTPFFTQRRAFSEPWTDDRSWLFRLAYQTGHHLIGSEVQQISSAYDFLKSLPAVDSAHIGVAGSGQGGLIALYAAALDDRLSATLVSRYFDHREKLYDEPEDRIVWSLLKHFGDAEIASLIAPRDLVIAGGGPGATAEFKRVRNPHAQMASEGGGLELFCRRMGEEAARQSKSDRLMDPDRIAQIANAQFSQWQARYRNMALESYAIREAAWKADTKSIAAYQRWSQPKREDYFDLIGRFPDADGPIEAKSIKLYDKAEFTGYRLSVRLYERVHAYGILLVPKGIRPGERRPVVFTQHGHRGTPESALGVEPDPQGAIYASFGMNLAKRGYIVFAPMISTQDSAERDRVALRSHLLGQLPLGIEVKKFGRVLDYLSTLPFVDKERFAFYGLSYGGYTALWTGAAEPRFKVVIASGHFNDWSAKTTDLTQGTSFLFYPRNFDMFNFDLLNRFSHAEIAMLTAPRPFMIEVGDRDGVVIAPRRFADLEMKRVEDLYAALGIPERGRVARFNGPHKVDGVETFQFLDRWLNWRSEPRQ
jgi:dienelactone hydrolase